MSKHTEHHRGVEHCEECCPYRQEVESLRDELCIVRGSRNAFMRESQEAKLVINELRVERDAAKKHAEPSP